MPETSSRAEIYHSLDENKSQAKVLKKEPQIEPWGSGIQIDSRLFKVYMCHIILALNGKSRVLTDFSCQAFLLDFFFVEAWFMFSFCLKNLTYNSLWE